MDINDSEEYGLDQIIIDNFDNKLRKIVFFSATTWQCLLSNIALIGIARMASNIKLVSHGWVKKQCSYQLNVNLPFAFTQVHRNLQCLFLQQSHENCQKNISCLNLSHLVEHFGYFFCFSRTYSLIHQNHTTAPYQYATNISFNCRPPKLYQHGSTDYSQCKPE